MDIKNPDLRLTPDEVNAVYKIPPTTLKLWRWRRKHNHAGNQGPKFERCGGKKILYRVKDLEEWLSNSSKQMPVDSKGQQYNRKKPKLDSQASTDELAQAEKATTEWVSVKKRLPKHFQWILWHDVISGDTAFGHFTCRSTPDYFTHWIPLPDRPKEIA